MNNCFNILFLLIGTLLSQTDTSLTIYGESNIFEGDSKIPEITWQYPNGNEEFEQGQSINLEWIGSDETFNNQSISIYYSENLGASFNIVNENISIDDVVSLNLPNINSAFGRFKITAIDSFGNSNEDKSDLYFIVGEPDYQQGDGNSSGITLNIENESNNFTGDSKLPILEWLYPQDGEQFDKNETISTLWIAEDDSFNDESISIYLSEQLGGFYDPVIENTANTLTYDVNLPFVDQAFARFKIKAIDSFGNQSEDYGDNYFIIGDPFGDYNVNPYDDLVILDWGWGNYHNILVTPEALSFMDDGDEIHAVDENGIIAEDCGQENYGAVSVASETYFQDLTSPLNLYCLEGNDYCGDNNSISAGYVKGNPVTMLHYDQSADTFFELSPNFSSWSGNFGDTPQDTLRFQYYSASENKTYIINESIPFTPSMIEGDAMFPVEYTYDENNFIDGQIECEFNPYEFEFWGSITSTVQDMQVGDQFATFVNGECRSLDSAVESPFETTVVLMNIYGNAALSVVNSFNRSNDRIIDDLYQLNTRQDYNFNIYRDNSLLESDIDEFYYIDKNTEDGQSYCYAITLKDNEDNELLISENQCIDLGLDLGQILGDLNGDEIINILDVVMLINIIFSGEQNSSADINDDGIINILDVVTLINIIFES